MPILQFMSDLFLHLDVKLAEWVALYGSWIYAMLFAIVFCETGLVVMPLLPGDSLLFTAGMLASPAFTGQGIEGAQLSLPIVWGTLVAAALLGDNVNYVIGRFFGEKILASERGSRIVNPSYRARTEEFFHKHGGKTVFLGRFFPIIRTFVPFMAGVGKMHWPRFLALSTIGTLVWVTVFVGAGRLWGNLPFVRENFELVVFSIIGITLAPSIYHAIKSRIEQKRASR